MGYYYLPDLTTPVPWPMAPILPEKTCFHIFLADSRTAGRVSWKRAIPTNCQNRLIGQFMNSDGTHMFSC